MIVQYMELIVSIESNSLSWLKLEPTSIRIPEFLTSWDLRLHNPFLGPLSFDIAPTAANFGPNDSIR